MRVFLVANTGWFIANFNLGLCRAITAAGHEVVVVSPRDRFSMALEEEGYRHIPLDLERQGTNPLRELGVVRTLTALYQREKPDLLHHFTLKCVLYGSMAAQRTGIGAVVNTIPGLGSTYAQKGLRSSVMRWVIERLCRRALTEAETTFCNREDRLDFVGRGLIAEKKAHLLLGAGVDTRHFVPSPKPEGPPLVVLVARMLSSKGVELFVQSARQLRAEGVPGRFALIGEVDEGNPDTIAPATMETWKEEGAVEVWGFRKDMRQVYGEASVLCLPTFYREGLPTVLSEAAACGLPLVATDIRGCREIARDGENALVVPPRDQESLTAALSRLLREPELRRRLGARGREIVELELSEDRIVSDTLGLYRKVSSGEGEDLFPWADSPS